MSGDEYVALLLERQAQAPTGPWGPVPLERFVRPGDEQLFTPPTESRQPVRVPQPRTYRPASYWVEALAVVEAEMRGYETPLLSDRAAAGGVGLGVRGAARVQQREDARLARYAQLRWRADGMRERLARAQRREQTPTPDISTDPNPADAGSEGEQR